MNQTFSFSKTGLSGISDSLSTLFSSLNQDATTYTRAVSGNMVTLVSSRSGLGEVEALVESLAMVHPSRFFVVVLDDSADQVEAEVAAMCHGLSKSEHSCSEIVRLVCPPRKIGSIPNILRAHFLPGLPTELFLIDPAVGQEIIDPIAALADQVFLDSSDFEDRIDLLENLHDKIAQLVDFQWVQLGTWRDQIRAVFDRAAITEVLSGLQSIEVSAEIRGNLRSSGGHAVCGLLMAGWMVDRLGLEPLKYSNYRFECKTPSGGMAQLRLHTTGPARQTRLSQVQLGLHDQSGKDISINFTRGDLLDSIVQMPGQTFRLSRPHEDESRSGCIRRYFLIGESFANYDAAFEWALELDRLWKAA